ncbi:hypothetical protein LPB86_03695 [Pedobacter sp. MC2016-14]|uniref:HYC_CC_PP family protein n=1 Tax=Pedobacter sp. MC2016-14 TaxID=2897327 RepID=UPI001E4724C4|nr:hypothetical protein [Pedobacter sp. MC2016-14]MCD0487317.1 hypothetical protein [Pedobacter sp. MC2016-14]
MKLRQKIALGLCAFYLVSVIGVALSLHFCGGKLASIHFTETAKCKICKTDTKMGKNSGCCKNTDVSAKVTDSHESGFKVNLPKDFSVKLFLSPILAEVAQKMLPHFFGRMENKAPPLSARISLHLYNCVFRN